jgi:hypothetical protein
MSRCSDNQSMHVMLLTSGSVRVDFLFSCGSKLLSAAEFFKGKYSYVRQYSIEEQISSPSL